MNIMPFIVGAITGVAIKSDSGRQLIETILEKANIEAQKAFFPEKHNKNMKHIEDDTSSVSCVSSSNTLDKE